MTARQCGQCPRMNGSCPPHHFPCWLDDNGYGDVDYSQSSRPEQEEAEECAKLRKGDACLRHGVAS